VQGISITQYSRDKLTETEKELKEEKAVVESLL
jgi:hypothetical protein